MLATVWNMANKRRPSNHLSAAAKAVSLFAGLVLAGCSAPVVKQDPVPATTGQTGPKPVIVSIEPVRPDIDLTEDMLIRLLEAEFAGQRGHIDVSLENYLELARETADPKIIERATRIAVFARNEAVTAELANMWVELDPRNPDAHQILAVMALRKGEVETALLHLESILDYTDGEMDQKLLMIASMLGREADKDMIMEVMEKITSGRQDSPEALFAFSRVAAVLGEYERALELLEKTYSMKPDDQAVALSYVSILQRLDRFEEALTWLEAALNSGHEDDFELRLAYARLLTDVRRYDDSVEQFEILTQQDPENEDVLFALGLLHLQSDRVDDAEKYLLRLTSRSNRSNEVSYYLGRIAEDRGEFARSAVWYQGVQSGPNYLDAQVRLAYTLARQDRLEDARKHLQAVRTQNEGDTVMLIQAEAGMLVELERFEEAMQIYNTALDGKYDADLLYARAMLAEKMDRLDILEADLRKVIETDPQNAQALNALGYTLADRTDRFVEAEQLIDRALQLRPDDHFILDSKGWVLYRLGKLDEAITYLRRALELIPDAEIAAHLGEVLWVSGNKKEAKKVWDSALKATPDNAHLQDVIERFDP
jgi:tetratricopeptide (TPR) repeat protein